MIVEREDRPWWRRRYHWTVERLDGTPRLLGEGRAYTVYGALRVAAIASEFFSPYQRTEATVLSRWVPTDPQPAKRSPLQPELAQRESSQP